MSISRPWARRMTRGRNRRPGRKGVRNAIHDVDDPGGYEDAKPGTVPDAEAVARRMKYNEALQKAGVLLALDGLHPPSMGCSCHIPGRHAEGHRWSIC